MLDGMFERKCTPNINAFTSILRAYCMKGMIGEAKRLIFFMEKNGFVPDTIIYSVLIEGLCRIGEFGEVERVLGECDLKGWKPNEVTYNSYMNGLCKWGLVDEAFRQLEAMQSRGLFPDNVTLSILFDCLCRDDSKLWTAKCLLERNAELGWYVDVYFYNSLMNRLCETGNWSSVLKLLTDMMKKGIDPNTCTFTIVIRSLCLAGKFKKAICIICSQGFDADIVAFNTLIHRLSMAGMVAEAQLMFGMMNGQSIMPNEFTYCMMIDCLCKSGYFCEAIKCVLSSLKGGFLPDLVTRVNYWLINNGKFEEMLSLFDEFLARGVAINGVVVSLTIKALCMKGFCLRKEFNKVGLILDKMLGIR